MKKYLDFIEDCDLEKVMSKIQQIFSGSQKILGEFFKKELPCCTTYGVDVVNLPLLGMLSKGGKEDEAGLFGSLTLHHSTTLVGPSGCGKTVRVVDLAQRAWVIYIFCDPANQFTKDPNFLDLIRSVECSWYLET